MMSSFHPSLFFIALFTVLFYSGLFFVLSSCSPWSSVFCDVIIALSLCVVLAQCSVCFPLLSLFSFLCFSSVFSLMFSVDCFLDLSLVRDKFSIQCSLRPLHSCIISVLYSLISLVYSVQCVHAISLLCYDNPCHILNNIPSITHREGPGYKLQMLC